jgi:hypothetical protein
MEIYDVVLSAAESYDNFAAQYLEFSKLARVLRYMNALPDDKLPRNMEFRFRERAQALVDKWEGMHAMDESCIESDLDETPSKRSAPEETETNIEEAVDSSPHSPTKVRSLYLASNL